MASNVNSGATATRGGTPTQPQQRGGFRGFVDRIRGRVANVFQRTRGR